MQTRAGVTSQGVFPERTSGVSESMSGLGPSTPALPQGELRARLALVSDVLRSGPGRWPYVTHLLCELPSWPRKALP